MIGLIQPKDYGDVIAVQGLANYHKVIDWPVCGHVFEAFRHFPQFNPIKIDHDYMARSHLNHCSKIIDIYNHAWLPGNFIDEKKYSIAEVPFEEKYSGFKWKRFVDKENELYSHVVKEPKYVVRHHYNGWHISRLKTDLPIVDVVKIEGFTLLDWYKVFYNAQEIHMIDSSPANFVECTRINVPKHLHLYSRWNTMSQPAVASGFRYKDDWIKHYK